MTKEEFINQLPEMDDYQRIYEYMLPKEGNLIYFGEDKYENIPGFSELSEKLDQLISIPNKHDYLPEHQTILKKYTDFPKLFEKLFKDQKVRTVTDDKENTWFEVDIPKGYLNREWQFKLGGKLIHKQ